MFSDNIIVNVVSLTFATTGFAMLWNIKRTNIPLATLNGFMTWVCYLFMVARTDNIFASCLVASLLAVVAADIMARIKKTISTQFAIAGLFTLLPGSYLYYTMDALIRSNTSDMRMYAADTAYTILGLSSGICLANALLYMIRLRAKKTQR